MNLLEITFLQIMMPRSLVDLYLRHWDSTYLQHTCIYPVK
jgi:hypothetical protein